MPSPRRCSCCARPIAAGATTCSCGGEVQIFVVDHTAKTVRAEIFAQPFAGARGTVHGCARLTLWS